MSNQNIADGDTRVEYERRFDSLAFLADLDTDGRRWAQCDGGDCYEV